MPGRSYPDNEPAWVENPDTPGVWVLWWIEDGKPVEPIGVDRECDVPGIHTPAAAMALGATSADKQLARLWPSASDVAASEPDAASDEPQSDAGA